MMMIGMGMPISHNSKERMGSPEKRATVPTLA
jgi:hypothetical protein